MKKKIFILTILSSVIFGVGASAQETKFFEIKAKKFEYTPNIIRVDKGDNVRIRLISEDVHHGFFLDGYNKIMSAYPGKDGGISFVADKSGKFNFRCSVTCGEFHPYMIGYFIVGSNSRFIFYVVLTILIGLVSIYIMYRKHGEGENVSG